MNNLTDARTKIIGGVDTHKDTHVAAALDEVGRLLATESFSTTPSGYCELLSWLQGFGDLTKVGVEGTSSWGAGLKRFLHVHSVEVIEVSAPNRQRRRLKGKSDPTDAEAAARAVLSGEATAIPKSGDGPVEAIRQLRLVLRSALHARTQAANQIHSLIDTSSDALREQLRERSLTKTCAIAARFRPAPLSADTSAATKTALRHLARRWLDLSTEIKELRQQLKTLVERTAPPALLATYGVGTDTAAALLVTIGDNPQRCTNEATFAALCGVSPRDASSGRHQRHRLNRGGDRSANNALWRIVIVRLRYDERTQAYMKRKLAEGKTKPEIIRCLKRYLARQLWRTMHPAQARRVALKKAT